MHALPVCTYQEVQHGDCTSADAAAETDRKNSHFSLTISHQPSSLLFASSPPSFVLSCLVLCLTARARASRDFKASPANQAAAKLATCMKLSLNLGARSGFSSTEGTFDAGLQSHSMTIRFNPLHLHTKHPIPFDPTPRTVVRSCHHH